MHLKSFFKEIQVFQELYDNKEIISWNRWQQEKTWSLDYKQKRKLGWYFLQPRTPKKTIQTRHISLKPSLEYLSIGGQTETMLWSPRLSLSYFHVKLTAKGLFRNLQLLSGCRKNTVVFHAGLNMPLSSMSSHHPAINCFIFSTHPSFCSSINAHFRPTGWSPCPQPPDHLWPHPP